MFSVYSIFVRKLSLLRNFWFDSLWTCTVSKKIQEATKNNSLPPNKLISTFYQNIVTNQCNTNCYSCYINIVDLPCFGVKKELESKFTLCASGVAKDNRNPSETLEDVAFGRARKIRYSHFFVKWRTLRKTLVIQ